MYRIGHVVISSVRNVGRIHMNQLSRARLKLSRPLSKKNYVIRMNDNCSVSAGLKLSLHPILMLQGINGQSARESRRNLILFSNHRADCWVAVILALLRLPTDAKRCVQSTIFPCSFAFEKAPPFRDPYGNGNVYR